LEEDEDGEMVMGCHDRLSTTAADLLSKHRSGKKSKHSAPSKREHSDVTSVVDTSTSSSNQVKKIVTHDDDIFEDAGDYVPNVVAHQDQKRARIDEVDGDGDGDYFGNLRAGTKREDDQDEKSKVKLPVAADILKGVKNLAAVSDKLGSRKKPNEAAMDGEGVGYGETFDFDFNGAIESRDD
jgi:hypothetical protein